MPSSFHIRIAHESDASEVARVHNESFSDLIDTLGFRYSYRLVNDYDVLEWMNGDDCIESKIFVAENEEMIGYLHCILCLEKGRKNIPVLYFRSTGWEFGQARLGVIPSYRRQGLGSALIRYSIQSEWQQTPRLAVASMYENNTAANRLFEKLGFQKHDLLYIEDYSEENPIVTGSVLASFDLSREIPSFEPSVKVKIRRAVEEDAEAISQISQRNVWWNPTTWTAEWSKRFILGEFSHMVFVAERDGRVVGEMNYIPNSGEIGFTGIHPDHQRLGIGTYFMTQLLSIMKSRGLEEAIADSGLTQVDAIRLYKRLGFEMIKRNAFVMGLE